MRIGVFCSANINIDPLYIQTAKQLGEWIAHNGHDVVFGGCESGLMGVIGHSVHDNGGRAIGVVPTLVEKGGITCNCLDVHIPCDNLSDRKDLLLLHSDILVALPGGIGTLDEIFTVAASHTIGYHSKKVVLLNINGFWDKLIELLDYMDSVGMIRGDYHRQIECASSLEELISLLND